MSASRVGSPPVLHSSCMMLQSASVVGSLTAPIFLKFDECVSGRLPAIVNLLDLVARSASQICLLGSICSICSLAMPRKFAWFARFARSGCSFCLTNLPGALDLLDLAAHSASQVCLVRSICLTWVLAMPRKFAQCADLAGLSDVLEQRFTPFLARSICSSDFL